MLAARSRPSSILLTHRRRLTQSARNSGFIRCDVRFFAPTPPQHARVCSMPVPADRHDLTSTNHSFNRLYQRYATSTSGSSPFARLSKSNDDDMEKRVNQNGRDNNFRGSSSFQQVSHVPDSSNEDVFDSSDDNLDNIYMHSPSSYYEDQENEYQLWHDDKAAEYQQLSSATDELLTSSPPSSTADVEAILELMQQWNHFLSGITPELYALSDFRKLNPQYPPSEFISTITYDSATKTQQLLSHLFNRNTKLSPDLEVTAYKLAMEAWSNVFHSHSGDKCEEILELFGERFGGDMNYMPSIASYRTVLKAHGKSCSSYMNDGTTSPGENALGLLNLLSSLYTAGDLFLKPDVEMYSQTIEVVRNTLLDWQLRRRLDMNGALERELANGALNALKQMKLLMDEEKKSKKEGEGNQRSLEQWNCVIRAYSDALAIASRLDTKCTPEQLLQEMEAIISSNTANITDSFEDSDLDDSITQCTIDEMQRNVEHAYTNAILSQIPSNNEYFADFNVAMGNAMNSDDIFQRMKQRSLEAHPGTAYLFPHPTQHQYAALIRCVSECLRNRYSTSESNRAMAQIGEFPHVKASRLLNELEQIHSAKSDSLPIDGSIYSKVLWAWCQTVNWESISRQQKYYIAANSMRDILRKAMDGYERGFVSFSQRGDGTKMFNFAFRFLSKNTSGGKNTAGRSIELLNEMEHWYNQSEGTLAKPDAFTFSLILKTISNSGDISSASTAESVMARMDSFGIVPSEKHYLGLMRSYSRIGRNDVLDPHKTEAILHQVKKRHRENGSVKPTTALYSACISAYAGSASHNNMSKVMELHNELSDLYATTNDPAFKPDSKLYSIVLDAIAKVKDSSALSKAFQLLDEMEKRFDAGVIDEGPNRYAYSNLLHSISQSRVPNSAILAEELVHRMESRATELEDDSILPDKVTYTTLLQVFSRSSQPDAIERAERWFQRMEQQYEGGDIRAKPNKVTYTAMINCWWHSGRPNAGEKAEQLLQRMEKQYEEGEFDLKPDSFAYGSVINAWCRTKSDDKAIRAWELYLRMKTQYAGGNMELKPNNIIVSIVCAAAAS